MSSAFELITEANRAGAIERLQARIKEQPDFSDIRLAEMLGRFSLMTDLAQKALAEGKLSQEQKVELASWLAESDRENIALDWLSAGPLQDITEPNKSFLFATLLMLKGDKEASISAFERVLKVVPDHPDCWLGIVKQDTSIDGPKILAALKESVKGSKVPTRMLFAIGKAFENGGDLTSAAKYYRAGGNALNLTYDPAVEARLISDIRLAPVRSLGTKDTQFADPIFVVSFPRSGSTFVTDYLSRCEGVAGSGELDTLAKSFVGSGINFKDAAVGNVELCEQRLLALRENYGEINADRFGKHGVVVDKSISNARLMPLLVQLFPRSKFVFLTREIEASMWSCFGECFSTGLDWSFRQDWLGSYFKVETRYRKQLMEKYSDRIIEVDFTTFVRSESDRQALLERLNLKIGVTSNNRAIRTASVAQIRDKDFVYDTSTLPKKRDLMAEALAIFAQ